MNMSYCRFQNTQEDLSDCLDYLTDVLSKDEHEARKHLIQLCRNVVHTADSGDVPDKSKDEIESQPDYENNSKYIDLRACSLIVKTRDS